MIIEANGINAFYGTSHILFDLSLAVEKGEIVCLLGRNGAGKTTTMRSIMGLTPPKSGKITFQGIDITGKPPYIIARLGVGYVPDSRRIFPGLTVLENLEVAIRTRSGSTGRYWTTKKVFELFPDLKRFESLMGDQLSGGQQQMLAIARTLMTNPEFMLLDEPGEGLSPLVMKTLGEQIKVLKDEGITVLLSEQNVKFACGLSDRAYVIDKGNIRYKGTMEELMTNDEIKKQYLMI